MFIQYTHQWVKGRNVERASYKSLGPDFNLTTRLCVAVSKFAKRKSGLYLIDRWGKVRKAQ